MSESMYKLIGKAYCTANPDYFWTYEECLVSSRKAFKIYAKTKHKGYYEEKVMFDDSWYEFDRDVCTYRVMHDIVSNTSAYES
jgi:hypothetical protein